MITLLGQTGLTLVDLLLHRDAEARCPGISPNRRISVRIEKLNGSHSASDGTCAPRHIAVPHVRERRAVDNVVALALATLSILDHQRTVAVDRHLGLPLRLSTVLRFS